MAIPDYETLMLPVLKIAGDGQEHRIRDVTDQLARDFGLTEEELQQVLPSGKQTSFANRVGWAKSYLVQAGLLESTRRAHFKITDRERKSLLERPPHIDNLAEFVQFKERGRVPGTAVPNVVGEAPTLPLQAETPDELLRSTVKQIETALKKELLDRILGSLLLALGYGG